MNKAFPFQLEELPKVQKTHEEYFSIMLRDAQNIIFRADLSDLMTGVNTLEDLRAKIS
ncbi:MAG: hypothetical protein M0R17_00820 [Candidatus Omnitrophica bacterium]|jgi:hypothetical protein|nr:hypothetical protein [Candidatus Omnitrophota bacterium]